MSFESEPIAIVKITFDELSPEVKNQLMQILKLTSALMLSSIIGVYTLLFIFSLKKISLFIQYITNTRYASVEN